MPAPELPLHSSRGKHVNEVPALANRWTPNTKVSEDKV